MSEPKPAYGPEPTSTNDHAWEAWHTRHAQALAAENRRLRADVLDLKGTVTRLLEEVERLREPARATA